MLKSKLSWWNFLRSEEFQKLPVPSILPTPRPTLVLDKEGYLDTEATNKENMVRPLRAPPPAPPRPISEPEANARILFNQLDLSKIQELKPVYENGKLIALFISLTPVPKES